VPVGSYVLHISILGYKPATKTDIIVGAERSVHVNVELQESAIQADEVVVTAGYFNDRPEQPVSSISFAAEEVRRAPGSGGDVSRIILGLPSLAKVNDQSNSLIVRGGSPMENAFYVDGIEVPNINHFPTQGATGGPIGIIDASLLDDVSFNAGGFSAAYGDKLSSVMELRLKDGSRTSRQSQLDFNFAGIGAMTEGPIGQDAKASYLVSVRRSYLDALVHTIDIGTTVAPSYGDVVAKVTADIAPGHTLTVLDVFSDDHNNPDKKTAVENDMIFYGNQDIYVNTAGITWRALWSPSLYSNASISYSTSKFSEDYFETNSGAHLVKNRSLEATATITASLHYRINSVHSFEAGVVGKHLSDTYDNLYDSYTDALGARMPEFALNTTLEGWKMGGYVNYMVRPTTAWTITAGARIDHFPYNSSTTVAPRFSASFQASDRLTLKTSAGIYYQTLPMLLLSQAASNKTMKNPEALHLIAGADYLLTENTKLTLEAYRKTYDSFPTDPSQPSLFLVDEVFYRYGFYFAHGGFQDNGRAESNGIEIVVQKKLAENFYGLASASYFTTRYKSGDGIWRDRGFDNRVVVALEGGYRLDENWEFSGRWIYAGGVPYTPFDQSASTTLQRAVLDESRINGDRLPAYHCLNVRVDRRWHFASTNLTAYVSIWNAYDRNNTAGYFWNGEKQRQEPISQWGLLPIFGVKYEF
ncbi:MAG TPA: TonB-dependent receptor, partial [Bacteroidota bacterium]|nr:TonB-dependent receptor [Bacteroidota bacterium]